MSFWSTPDQDPKAAKCAVLIPGPGMLVNVRNAPRVVIPPPTQNTTCFAVCALVCDPLSRAECVPIFTRESKRGPFVPEVLKTVWTMCWKRWYDCVSCTFHGFFEGEKESRRKALALFAPMPIHSSPQCGLPQGFAGFGN